jgi:hypothetical protein
LPDAPRINAIAHTHNFPRDFKPRDGRRARRWRIHAATLQYVWAIHAGCGNTDQHLACARLRDGALDGAQDVWPACFSWVDTDHLGDLAHVIIS